MVRKLLVGLCFLAFLFAAESARAQCSSYTQVTGTVTDPNGVPYAGASLSVAILGTASPTCTGPDGLQHPFTGTFATTLDPTGSFAIQLPPNSIISPGGTQWNFSISITVPPPVGRGNQSFTYAATISGSSQSLSSALSALAPAILYSGAGGGCSPSGNTGDLQDKATNGSCGASGINDSGTYANQITVSKNTGFVGPRPYIDVTAYGAKGDGVTDDTTAIQSAITAACSSHASVWFPEGNYIVSQPQTPSTSSVFTTCGGLHLFGVSDGNGGAQFVSPPMSQISVAGGASPNSAAVFQFIYPQVNITVDNLVIDGINQAVALYGSSNVHFNNDCFSVGTSGMTDNAPVKIDTAIWVWFKDGCMQTQSGTVPDVILTTTGTNQDSVQGLAYFDDMIWAGGGVQYINRGTGVGGTPGNEHFRNISVESCNAPFFAITNTAGAGQLPEMTNLSFENIVMADCSGNDPLVDLNSSGTVLSQVDISNSQPGNQAAGVVLVNAGSIYGVNLRSCAGDCQVVDGSGNPVSGAVIDAGNGIDVVANSSDLARLRDDIWGAQEVSGPAFRTLLNGGRFAGVGIDSQEGYLLGDRTNYGYNAQVYQSASSPATVDIGFASTLPPSGVSASGTTGGTIAAGTYYYYVKSTIGTSASACGVPADVSAPALPASVILSGSNDAVLLNWTVSASSPATVNGYCIYRTFDPAWNDEYQPAEQFVSGAGTTTFTDTGGGSFHGFSGAANAMQSVHRFTINALGVNTLNPLANSISLAVGGFLGSLTHANTANRTYTLPDASGTVCLTSTCTGTGNTTSTSLTSGFLPKANGANSIVNSGCDEGITTANTFTCTDSAGAKFSGPIVSGGATHGITVPAGTAASGAAGSVVYASDPTNGYGEINENNGGLSRICTAANGICGAANTQTICSGTIALGTAAIASGAAATTVTATCTGLASTDNIELDFNASPLAVTGYVPSANGMLTIIKWPTSNTINVAVVNNTSASITPGSITLNYRVVR